MPAVSDIHVNGSAAWSRLIDATDEDALDPLCLRSWSDVVARAKRHEVRLRVFIAHLLRVLRDDTVRHPGSTLSSALDTKTGHPPKLKDLRAADEILFGSGKAVSASGYIRVAFYSGKCGDCKLESCYVWPKPPQPPPKKYGAVCPNCGITVAMDLVCED